MAATSQAVKIVNKRGLHARASARFVGAAAAMEGTTIRVRKDGNSALGSSILGLMMLGAARGDAIELTVRGAKADERLAELVALVEGGFGED